MILYNINFCECMCGAEIKEGKRFVRSHHSKGITRSEETKQKIKIARSKQISSGMKGRHHTEEAKEKNRQAHLGKQSLMKGKKVSDEIRKKNSEAHKGIHSSLNTEFKKGQEPWNKGLTGIYKEETIEKMSEAKKGKEVWNKGVPQTEEQRKKNSEAHKGLMVGENSPSWKGGPQTELLKQRRCDEYKEWVKQVFKRDGYKCHRCNNGGVLSAHHIFNFYKLVEANQYLWDINNGITLCKDCHKQFHYKYGTQNNSQQQIFEFIYLQSYGV